MPASTDQPARRESLIPAETLARIHRTILGAEQTLSASYPGDPDGPQPVHTVYESAAVADITTPSRWGAAALEHLDAHADLLRELAGDAAVYLARRRLADTPIQDLRIDFEDGYGSVADEIEDGDALRAGQVLSRLGLDSCGVRIKGLTTDQRHRAIRTLELVLDAAGGVPAGFVFTVPKLRAAEQVTAAVLLCEGLEQAHGLRDRPLRFELQVETPQAVLGRDGTADICRAIQLADGRCIGLHYGTYDFSAACGIAPQYQALDHPIADHAKAVMMLAAAQTGVRVVDGGTQIMPGRNATDAGVAHVLRRHYELVTRSIHRGYYQGWDMHPTHLVTRWLATFAFHHTALAAAAPRLQAYLDRRGGPVADEPATAEALAAVVLRGLDCDAYTTADVLAAAPSATVPTLRQLRKRTHA